MTIVSNDPSWWPIINSGIFFSYWTVAAGIVVIYDWLLTLGQEVELIWIRYIGIPYSVNSSSPTISANILITVPLLSLTDAGCNIVNDAINGINVVVTAMLGVIMIARLHAMYQRSRIILIFLVIIFLAINIACGVIVAITLENIVGEELILSGTYMCDYGSEGDTQLLPSMVWMLNTVWEVFALCFSVWIAVKHFRDLRRFGPSTGSTIGDCFRVLIQSHVLYFASSALTSFVCVSSIELGYLSPELAVNSYSAGAQVLNGALQILLLVQMFLLGPRLILSVREYHAQIVGNSDADTSMDSIVFQEHKPTCTVIRDGQEMWMV
ncbi:hypothetical protein BD769DRAFT_1387984 [Suillus cothurnatus]|nr:hypothetical protein BD769DRAFT_1387984 [Suillus cothurnatus]